MMFRRLHRVETIFWMLILAGGFVLLYMPIRYQATSCEQPQSEALPRGPEKTGAQPTTKQQKGNPLQPQQAKGAPKHSAQARRDQEKQSNIQDRGWVTKAVCDARLTDVALVYFTFCLVIVGWATMRSNESTMRDIERARLTLSFGDASMMIPNGLAQLVFGVTNSGKTRAVLKEFYIARSSAAPVGARVRYPRDCTVAYCSERVEYAYPPNNNFMQTGEFWCDLVTTPFVFGFFRYIDCFGGAHTARFSLKFENGTLRPAGRESWNEDD